MMNVSDSMTDCSSTVDVRARRRKLHTEAEQRRRDAIKRGFDSLLELIPSTKAGAANSRFRMSKATILNRSISMILKGSKIQNQKRMEIEMLKNKVQALKILKSSYERMSSASNYTTENEDTAITEQYKLQLFQMFMESLFQSFDAAVTESTFSVLSDQIVNWLENTCKPELLHRTMEHLLDTTLLDGYNMPSSQPQRTQQAPPQPQNTMFEVQTATECMGQQQPRLPSSSYRRQSLKPSNSLEASHESPFLTSDSPMNVSDRYQQSSAPGFQRVVFNPSTTFEPPHSIYSDQSQQHLQQQSGYMRHQPLFQMHSYQSSDGEDGSKFSMEMPSNSLQRHPSVTPPSQSSLFQRSPDYSGMCTSRSLVVNSSLPVQNLGAVTSYVSPQQEGSFVAPQVQYNSGVSGGPMLLPSGTFAKQNPF
nr:max protein X [Hymenolepis microstoma]